MASSSYRRKPDTRPDDPKDDPKHDPKDDPKHDPKHDPRLDLQGQAQGQLQGQAQGQYQTAVQSVDTKVDNDNKNDNENSNENKNENKNEIDNKIDNKVDNSVDNKIDNKIENSVENKVEVSVDVDIDLDLKGDLGSLGTDDDDVIDIEEIKDIYGSVVITDVVDQKMDDGNMFNIDQVNNLVDIDFLHSAEVKNDAKFDASDLKAEGGENKFDDPTITTTMDDGNTVGDLMTTTADGIASVEAFTQNIVMGANIQFNSIDISAAGEYLTSEDVV